ncbi:hypothetical protein Tco_1517119, partial [Tanacetum coccineum]
KTGTRKEQASKESACSRVSIQDNGPDVDVYCGDSVYTSHDLIAQEKKQDIVKEMTKEVQSRKNGALNKTTDDLDDFWARLVALTYEHMGGEKEIELEDVLQFINNINGCTDIRHIRFPYYQCMFIATCFVVVGFGTHVGLLFRVASAGVRLTVSSS